MAAPYLTIDLDKIERNARTIVALCGAYDIAVSGVTKCVRGSPQIADAMLRGGVVSIGDSRIENIQRLRDAALRTPVMQLRLPALSGAEDTVRLADVSLNSELSVLVALSEMAQSHGRVHEVIIMVDLGELREGIWPDEVLSFLRETIRLQGVRLVGLGTNLTCFSGIVPSEKNMRALVKLVEQAEASLGVTLPWVSAANSSALDLIASGRMPKRINHARIGEAILLGRETVHRRPWPDTEQDAFVLHAEILELKSKPSLPIGKRGKDAFGGQQVYEDRGIMMRALLNVGREDVDPAGLSPQDVGLSVLGASSGYLAVDVSHVKRPVRVGDELAFVPNYRALLAAMTSDYVGKRLISGSRQLA